MLGCIIEIENKLQKSLYIVYNNKQMLQKKSNNSEELLLSSIHMEVIEMTV